MAILLSIFVTCYQCLDLLTTNTSLLARRELLSIWVLLKRLGTLQDSNTGLQSVKQNLENLENPENPSIRKQSLKDEFLLQRGVLQFFLQEWTKDQFFSFFWIKFLFVLIRVLQLVNQNMTNKLIKVNKEQKQIQGCLTLGKIGWGHIHLNLQFLKSPSIKIDRKSFFSVKDQVLVSAGKMSYLKHKCVLFNSMVII